MSLKRVEVLMIPGMRRELMSLFMEVVDALDVIVGVDAFVYYPNQSARERKRRNIMAHTVIAVCVKIAQ